MSRIPIQTVTYFDTQLERKLRPAPAHLERVLYIPRHDDKTTHLPLYEVRDRYHNAVRQFPMLGSALYTSLLSAMEKPNGDSMDDEVAYLTDIYKAGDGDVQIRLNKRELGMCDSEIQL